MADDKALMLRIAQLAGHINIHKISIPGGLGENPNQQPSPSCGVDFYQHRASRGQGRVRSHDRGRNRAATSHSHRNRSLVINNTASANLVPSSTSLIRSQETQETSQLPNITQNPVPQSSNSWVSKCDRHMQLINSAVYQKDAELRNRAIEQTRRQKAIRRDQREKLKINKHLQTIASGSSLEHLVTPSQVITPLHQVFVGKLRFRLCDGGSKLLRELDSNNIGRLTPKKATIGGVTYYRSKSGNLYRSGLVKEGRRNKVPPKIFEPCKRFTTTGRCSKGPTCPYIHDPTRVAICSTFLQTGGCPIGHSCDLSHDPTPERVPACLHFLRGRCSKPDCRYSHVRVNPSASICRDFAFLRYCHRGVLCEERHIFECPDYALTGTCRKKGCRLPHVDRAGQIRLHTANKSADGAKQLSEKSEVEEQSDLSSDESEPDEIDSDDIDSDGLDEIMHDAGDRASNTLSQQDDFVHL